MPIARLRTMLVAGALATIAVACASTSAPDSSSQAADPQFDGPAPGAVIGGDNLADLEFRIRGDERRLTGLVFEVDGTTLEPTTRKAGLRVLQPGPLDDGQHVVRVIDAPSDPAADPAAETEWHRWQFQVDTAPPDLDIDAPRGVVAGAPAELTGTTEPRAEVAAGDATARADTVGRFTLVIDDVDDGQVSVTARDDAGNVTTNELELRTVASRVTVDEIRAVHVSFCGWATPSLRDPILEMAEDGLITAVQLDIKDESGHIGYPTDVPLANDAGANAPNCQFDLREAVEMLHARGITVIGRFVAFADPVLAEWAWNADRSDWVIQDADGEMYVGRYAGFTNFAHPDVVDYNIAIATEAAALGVDHVLWDYIRRPDGNPDGFRFVGLDDTPEAGIVAFTRKADEALHPYGVVHGASVFGIASTRPREIAQDIPGMGEHLDYIAPMVYPTHWAPGEFGLADPERAPYEIVHASLDTFLEALDGRRARVIPWLEDSDYRAWDRHLQVAEQLRATRDVGIDEWMLWDPWVRYTPEAIIEVRDERDDAADTGDEDEASVADSDETDDSDVPEDATEGT
ncbi:MAG: putative glycoside hydrolase [Nitriliruptoraceae bacterium]